MEAELQRVNQEIAALKVEYYALLDKEERSKSEQYKVDNFEKELAQLRVTYNTLVTALATKRVEEQKKGILFSKALILDSKVSRHKPNTATIDSRCILTNIAAVFQEEYELDVKEGDTATFGDVLWALGNPSKNPKYYRAPAQPKEGYTVPIHKRLSRKDWMYYRALNDFTNPKAHPLPIPEVDGEMKLILPDDKNLYNPHRIEATFRKLGIIEQEDIITFQKESEQTSSEKSNSPTNSNLPKNP
jgi:hypothetical protein